MSEIKLSVDGREVAANSGQTLLKVCQDHGIQVPTLCHHAWLSDIGACRMCVVEVEGDRRLNTACTTPARDGMVVRTDTERLRKQRLLTLELLFSERNHICPFCAESGHCELQDLGYSHGMTHPRYAYLHPKLAPDTSSPYFVMEPNRCILCGRCVRACEEIAGVHTLEFGGRGSRQMLLADRGVPVGESTCVACGTCLEVCPTGAIYDKRSGYWAKERDLPGVDTTCPGCGVGCRFQAVTKHGRIVEQRAISESPVNGPLLCATGRFKLLRESRPRLHRPLIRRDGDLREVEWPEALALARDRLRSPRSPSRVGGLISSRLPDEVLFTFQKLLRRTVGTPNVAVLDAADLRVRREAVHQFTGNGIGAGLECGLDEVREADAYLVVGANLGETHPVVASWISRAVYGRQAPLIVVGNRQTSLARSADVWLRPTRRREGVVLNGLLGLLSHGTNLRAEARSLLAACTPAVVAESAQVSADDLIRASRLYADARSPVILYGQDLTRYGDPGLILTLMNIALIGGKPLSGRLGVCGMAREASSQGAMQMGMAADFGLDRMAPGDLDCVYLVAGDADPEMTDAAADHLGTVRSLILQASRRSPLVDLAEVVLPDLAWFERTGVFTNSDGRAQAVEPVLTPPAGVRDDTGIFAALAASLGEEWDARMTTIHQEMEREGISLQGGSGNGRPRDGRAPTPSGPADVRVVNYL